MRLYFTLAMLALVAACGNDTTPDVEVRHVPAPGPSDDGGFAAVKPLIDQNCGTCHNASSSLPKFDTAAAFKGSKAKSEIQGGDMPPNKKLSDDVKQKLLAFLNK